MMLQNLIKKLCSTYFKLEENTSSVRVISPSVTTVYLFLRTELSIDAIFFSLGFLSRTLTNHGQQGKREVNSKSSLPLPYSSQIVRHQPEDYCRELNLSTQLASGLEPRTIGYRAQDANQQTSVFAYSVFNFSYPPFFSCFCFPWIQLIRVKSKKSSFGKISMIILLLQKVREIVILLVS